MVFEELIRISDIPINRSSKKWSVLVYYNNAADFLDRLELLGGLILAGNNGAKNEFSQIVHTLKEYII